jgi:hypothetical protein
MWNGLPGERSRLGRVADAIGKNWSLLPHAINSVLRDFWRILCVTCPLKDTDKKGVPLLRRKRSWALEMASRFRSQS